MNSPSRYIPFVQEAAYPKLAIANQTPEKNTPPGVFLRQPASPVLFSALPMEMPHISKAFLGSEGSCCFQLSPSVHK